MLLSKDLSTQSQSLENYFMKNNYNINQEDKLFVTILCMITL